MSKFLDITGLNTLWAKIKAALNRIMVIGSASSISNDQVIFLVVDCGTAGNVYNTGVTISYVNSAYGHACFLHATPRLVGGGSFNVRSYALTDTTAVCPLKIVLWKDSGDNHYYIGFATTQRGSVSIGYTPIGPFASSFRTARIALSSITVIAEAQPKVVCSKTQLDTAISTLDDSVVHKTGTETVSGAKTFNNTDSVFEGKCASDINGVPLSSAYGAFRTALGSPTLEERGIIEESFGNQLECLPKAQIVYETSPKGTETWTTLAVSDDIHNLLWGGNVMGSLDISKTVDFRITINAPSYCYLSLLYFYASGQGATFHIKLEKKPNNSGTWSVVSDSAEANIGWPGNNTIRHDIIVLHPTTSSAYGSVRLTLYMVNAGDAETYPTYSINKFRYYGGYPYKADPWIVKDGSSGKTNFPKGITSGVAIPISSGGTGATTAANAVNNLLPALPNWTADPQDETKLIRRDVNGGALFGQVTFLTVWNYIKSKISSLLGLTATFYSGNAATASAAQSGSALETAINGKLGTSGNGSSVTVTPDGTSTGTDIGSSTTLKAWAQKFKNLVGSLKTVAFSGLYSDLSGTPSIPDDTAMVHKAGSEIITGVKTLQNALSPIWKAPTSQSLEGCEQATFLKTELVTEYASWTSAQKDGNHYRQWSIDITTLPEKVLIYVGFVGDYYRSDANGVIVKAIEKSGTRNTGGYIVANGLCRDEFAVSNVISDGDSRCIRIVSKNPAGDNRPRGLWIRCICPDTLDLSSVTLTSSIISGWPTWAGAKTTPAMVTADKATSVTTTPLTTQSTGKYMATVDDNGTMYTGSAVYDMSSNTLAVNINGNANTAAIATNYNTSEGGIRDALAGKAALSHSHGFITASGTMASTDGTFEAGDKLLFIDHNYSGAADMIRAVTNANGVLYFNGTKLNFGTLGVAYGGTGNTNAKAACNSFLASLDNATTDFDPSKDPILITGVADASSTTSYYRRPVSKILSWIMAKIPVVGGAIDVHACQIPYNYVEDHTSGNPAVDYIQYVDGSGTCYNVPCASPNLQGGGLNSDIRRIGLANGTTERTAAEMETNGATGQIFRSLRFNRSGGLAVLSGAVCFRPIAYKVDSSGTTVLTESADWNLMVKASGSGKQFKGTSFQPVHAHAVKIHLTDAYVPTTAYGVGVVDDIGTNGIFAKLSSGGILSFTVDSNYDFANFQRGKFYAFSITVTCP